MLLMLPRPLEASRVSVGSIFGHFLPLPGALRAAVYRKEKDVFFPSIKCHGATG